MFNVPRPDSGPPLVAHEKDMASSARSANNTRPPVPARIFSLGSADGAPAPSFGSGFGRNAATGSTFSGTCGSAMRGPRSLFGAGIAPQASRSVFEDLHGASTSDDDDDDEELFGGHGDAKAHTRKSESGPSTLFGGNVRTNQHTLFGNVSSSNPFSALPPPTTSAFTPTSTRAKIKTSVQRVPVGDALDLGTKILTISVGTPPNTQSFTIHSNLICSRPTHIAHELSTQPDLTHLSFPTIHPDTFALYIQLLYTGRLPSKHSSSADEYTALIRLYIMAASDRVTRNIALEAVLTKAKEDRDMPFPEHVWMVYKGTSGPCGARRMMVDFYLNGATERIIRVQSFPPEFMGGWR